MKISNEVADVLANSTVENELLFLPDYQLDRKLYMAVNKVLTAIKGKWNRGKKAHVFPDSPTDAIEEILATGEYTDVKKDLDQFFTSPELAEKVVTMININDNAHVVEPSAGHGAFADAITKATGTKPDCIEICPDCVKVLNEKGYDVIGGDFLQYNGTPDYFIGNPPFSKQQDIDHVNHMLDLAKKGVASIMSASVMFRTNKKTSEFRDRVWMLGGSITPLPDNSFVSSGTNVKTCVVIVEK